VVIGIAPGRTKMAMVGAAYRFTARRALGPVPDRGQHPRREVQIRARVNAKPAKVT